MEFPKEKFLAWYEENSAEIFSDFSEFLSIPSISTDPKKKGECLEAADFLISYLQDMGMEAERLHSPSLPAVFAKAGSKGENVLIYHHYDVQPEDPVELWKSPPFSPEIREGKIYARGASDNKGQCFITLTALKGLSTFMDLNQLEMKLFIEGEEESEGTGTRYILDKESQKLQAKALCVVDFDLPKPTVPGITLGYRGVMAIEVKCINSDVDMHSGMHGGIARNPLQLLSSALAAMYDEKGAVVVPGFFEGIEKQQLEGSVDSSFEEESYRKEFGVKALHVNPKSGGTIHPTIEINGISGGYAGEGFKTVIPSKAVAKVSCRLVPGQNPELIEQRIKEFLEKQMPSGVALEYTSYGGAPAFVSSKESSLVQKVASSLEETFGASCKYTMCGGSVPIVDELAKVVGGEVALFGFGLATDNIHAPNEHFRLDVFQKGTLAMARLLWDLAFRS